MVRVNKTVNNLQTVWNQLDKASEQLYNALDNLASMTNLSETVKRQMDIIDVSRVDGLKGEIEALIIEKGKELELWVTTQVC